ncbi:MAG: class I tRNA ligase family protein, partial [Clostridiales Family XIII bacterium]|nr:class I tRNA ligase family protein [Clostridiales Family XIII bacterium]
VEHAILHLLYARFFTKFLYDIGASPVDEPFTNLLTQGMVLKDGKKMSKSLGNVVSPDEIINKYGADTARLFILFASPPEKELEWSDAGVEGSYRFLNRVYRLVSELADAARAAPEGCAARTEADKELDFAMNRAIKKVSDDIGGRFGFNTAISSIMEFVNALYKYKELPRPDAGLLRAAVTNLILILSPFTPHICEELWRLTGHDASLYGEKWPDCDERALARDRVEIVIQINGKIKEKIEVESGLDKDALTAAAFADERVLRLTAGMEVLKSVAVPDKLLNIVVKRQ